MSLARTSAAVRWRPPVGIVDEAWLSSELVASRTAEVARAERALFDDLAGDGRNALVLFGAGNLGRRTLAGLREEGVEPLAFVDNSPTLSGGQVDGLEVLAPAQAVRRHAAATFVTTVWTPVGRLAYPAVAAQLRDLAGPRPVSFVSLYWKYARRFLPYHCLSLPHELYMAADEVKGAYARLADERSRREFLIQLSYLVSDMTAVEIRHRREGDWYFPRDLVALRDDEVFVDCGAYDGDTLLSFVAAAGARFAAAFAFEPNPCAADRLARAVAGLPHQVRERVAVEQRAVAAATGIQRFCSDAGPGSRVTHGGDITVEAVCLDDALSDSAPTFIKMDIEGAELDALAGARAVIARARPILAVCAYHRQEDIHRVPNTLAEMCPDYRFYLRRLEGDLVCFAVPTERSIDGGGV